MYARDALQLKKSVFYMFPCPIGLLSVLFLSRSTVRQRVVVVLKGRYKTVDEAEDEYGLSVELAICQNSILIRMASPSKPTCPTTPCHQLTT